ncbi:unnamed protein product [Rotaria magnacalcarata]|uniref:G-protein coupled receptors family 1 profile domain-containing protein n=3 Tax=Rotaria magnacalcarata TaxID=392030 RepID=A0A8S2PIJ4_9BILA|nr:unnamed protein product [Rotaria magnacalcarata]
MENKEDVAKTLDRHLSCRTRYVFIRHKNLRQLSTNIFICGLVLADFIESFFAIPLPTIAPLNCRWIFGYFGCVIEAIVTYFGGCSNMYMLCLISIDKLPFKWSVKRYGNGNEQQEQTKTMILLIHKIENVGVSCSIKWEGLSLSITSCNIVILIFVYLIPVTIMITTNFNSYFVILKCRCRASINLNESHTLRQYLIERRITFTVILIIGRDVTIPFGDP